jgi:hypothetical protein
MRRHCTPLRQQRATDGSSCMARTLSMNALFLAAYVAAAAPGTASR